jgi:ribonuclease R
MNLPELGRRLGVRGRALAELELILRRLERTGQIARIRHNRYLIPAVADLVAGRILMSRSGGGRLQPDDPGQARVTVPPAATATAFHQDRVLVRLESRRGPNREEEPQGKVIRILERARTRVVGTLQRSRQFNYVVPDDPRIPHDIYTSTKRGPSLQAKVGDKVVIELEEWISRHNNHEGLIVEVLGRADDHSIEVDAEIQQYDLP